MGDVEGRGGEGGDGVNFRVVTTEQRTDAWRQARVGQLTGTCAVDMLAKIKTGEAAARRDLRLRLVCERLTGRSQEDVFVSKDMQRGIDKEADAFAAYEALTGEIARTVGYLAHPELAAGCSPDGQIGNFTGIVEVKCPKSATHLRYLRSRQAPSDYLPQVQHNLWITGAQWCDFVTYDDRFPPTLRLAVFRIYRDEAAMKSYELLVRIFLGEVEKEYQEVAALAGVAA